MKKVLVAALLAAMIATPAMADLAPPGNLNPSGVSNFTSYNIGGAVDPRGFPYDSGDVDDVYDNGLYIGGFSNGPSTFYAGGIIDLPAGAFMCDDVTLAPGTTMIGSGGTGSGGIDWVYNNSAYGSGSHNVTLAFFNNPGGADSSIGTTLAAFTFGGGIPNGYYLLSAGLPQFAASGDIWACIAHSVATRHFFSGDPVDGTPGTANPAATYNGSSDNLMVVLTTAGASLFTGGSAPALLNLNWALQGKFIPEPTVAGLLAFGGLLAMRRRKA